MDVLNSLTGTVEPAQGIAGNSVPPKRSNSLNFLNVEYQPTCPEREQVDIVFVHGLNPFDRSDHANLTWTHKNNTFWPRDLVPKRLPNARVLVYGYNSSVLRHRDNVNIRQHADCLLERLHVNRQENNAEERPLIFVAHSLGGLVVKQALINAKINDTRFGSVLSATHGLMFFGTPHKGSFKADIGNKVQVLLKPIVAGSQLLEALGTNSRSTKEATANFRHLVDNFEVVTFFETKPSRIGLVGFGMTVPQSSSMIQTAKEIQLPIEGDHSSICKFADLTDQKFTLVIGHLRTFVTNALAKIQNKPFLQQIKSEPIMGASEPMERPKQRRIETNPNSPSYIKIPRTPSPPRSETKEYFHNTRADSGYGEEVFSKMNYFPQPHPAFHPTPTFPPPPYAPTSTEPVYQMASFDQNIVDPRTVVFSALHERSQTQQSIPMPTVGTGETGYDSLFCESPTSYGPDAYMPQAHPVQGQGIYSFPAEPGEFHGHTQEQNTFGMPAGGGYPPHQFYLQPANRVSRQFVYEG